MTIYQTELNKYPEFTEFLISLCQENVGFNETVVTIELITDESNWTDELTGFNIRYVAYAPNREYIHWKSVDVSNYRWTIINAHVKSVLRNQQLEKLGV